MRDESCRTRSASVLCAVTNRDAWAAGQLVDQQRRGGGGGGDGGGGGSGGGYGIQCGGARAVARTDDGAVGVAHPTPAVEALPFSRRSDLISKIYSYLILR